MALGASGGLKVEIAGVTAAKLQKGITYTSITCTVASTDYAATAVIPAGTDYVVVWAANPSIIAVDEATSASLGVPIPGSSTPQTFYVTFGAAGGDSTMHAQSATAGTVVYIAYLPD